jgi:hypothetical protein
MIDTGEANKYTCCFAHWQGLPGEYLQAVVLSPSILISPSVKPDGKAQEAILRLADVAV